MPDIMHLVRLAAAPALVWQAIATAEGIRGWWTPDAELDVHAGGQGLFQFGGERFTRVKVTRYEPPARLEWLAITSFRPEWVGTTIHFEITPEAGGAVLRLAHRSFPRADDDYAVCTTGWGIYLARLAQALQQ